MQMTPEHVAEHPMVTRTTAGTVIIECSGPHATVLAKILANHDALVAVAEVAEPPPGYSAEVWHHTLIRLLTEVAHLRLPVAEVIDVVHVTGDYLEHVDELIAEAAHTPMRGAR